MEESSVCPRHESGPQECTVVSKNPASEVRQAWSLILALLLAGCVTLEKSPNLAGLMSFTCDMKLMAITLTTEREVRIKASHKHLLAN